jgi:hypothetical protein
MSQENMCFQHYINVNWVALGITHSAGGDKVGRNKTLLIPLVEELY